MSEFSYTVSSATGGSGWTIETNGRTVRVTGVHNGVGRTRDANTDKTSTIEPVQRRHENEFVSLPVALTHYREMNKITGGFGPLIAKLESLAPKERNTRKG